LLLFLAVIFIQRVALKPNNTHNKTLTISLSLTRAPLTVRRGDLNARSEHGARFPDNGFFAVDLFTQPCKSRLPVLHRANGQTSVSSCKHTCHSFTWRLPFVEYQIRDLSYLTVYRVCLSAARNVQLRNGITREIRRVARENEKKEHF
jgi:hypothetical protein